MPARSHPSPSFRLWHDIARLRADKRSTICAPIAMLAVAWLVGGCLLCLTSVSALFSRLSFSACVTFGLRFLGHLLWYAGHLILSVGCLLGNVLLWTLGAAYTCACWTLRLLAAIWTRYVGFADDYPKAFTVQLLVVELVLVYGVSYTRFRRLERGHAQALARAQERARAVTRREPARPRSVRDSENDMREAMRRSAESYNREQALAHLRQQKEELMVQAHRDLVSLRRLAIARSAAERPLSISRQNSEESLASFYSASDGSLRSGESPLAGAKGSPPRPGDGTGRLIGFPKE